MRDSLSFYLHTNSEGNIIYKTSRQMYNILSSKSLWWLISHASVNIWYSGHNIYIYISFTIRKQILNPSGRSYVNNSSHFEIWIVIKWEALSSTTEIKSININQWLPRVKFPCKETFYKSFHDKFTQQNQVCTVIRIF